MTFLEKMDVVIQGPYTDFTDHLSDHYLKLPFVNNVIISCWESDKLPIKKRRVKYVRNKYPSSPGTDNKNLQIVTSLNGLKECETKFSIKIRSDQKFYHASMIGMYDFFMNNNERKITFQYNQEKPYNRILVAGYYPYLLFSCRDHMFWGNTDDLIDLFNIPLEYNSLVDTIKVPKERLGNYCKYFTRTETYIGAHYCSNFNEEINRILLLPKEHLYDEAIYWHYTKDISDNITPLVFKSFPKSVVSLEWTRWRESGFSFNYDEYLQCSLWDEDGF